MGELSEVFQWRGEVERGLTGTLFLFEWGLKGFLDFSDDEKNHVAEALADVSSIKA